MNERMLLERGAPCTTCQPFLGRRTGNRDGQGQPPRLGEKVLVPYFIQELAPLGVTNSIPQKLGSTETRWFWTTPDSQASEPEAVPTSDHLSCSYMFRNAQSIPPVLPHLWGPKGHSHQCWGEAGVYSLTSSYEGQTEFISKPLPLS